VDHQRPPSDVPKFRFARPYREPGEECASRFLVALGLDQPIE